MPVLPGPAQCRFLREALCDCPLLGVWGVGGGGGLQCPVSEAIIALPTLPGTHLLPGLQSLARAPTLHFVPFVELD